MKNIELYNDFQKSKKNTKYNEYNYKDKDFTISQHFPEIYAQVIDSYNGVSIFPPKLENKYHKTSFQS